MCAHTHIYIDHKMETRLIERKRNCGYASSKLMKVKNSNKRITKRSIGKKKNDDNSNYKTKKVVVVLKTQLQRLYESCQHVFRGPGTIPSPHHVQILRHIIDGMLPKDVGLSPDLHFFNPNNNSNVKGAAGRVIQTTIYKCNNFSLCIFFLPAASVIPLHNHPGMTVFSKLLLGTMHIKAYDWVVDPIDHHDDNVSVSPSKLRLAKLKADDVFTAPCDSSVLYPASGGNIHAFTAITPCAVLDVIGPPYSSEDGRDCSYYKDTPYTPQSNEERSMSMRKVEEEGAEELYGWLEEIEMPKESTMVGIPYLAFAMAASFIHATLLFIVLVFTCSVFSSDQLASSQDQTLLRIQGLLHYPRVLSTWNNTTKFCNTEPISSLTVGCYEDNITQLHIIGEKGSPPLPRNFSAESFFGTLVSLPSLKVLTLVSLGLRGQLPSMISHLELLEILNISSNFFHGTIPQELSALRNLQTLVLDKNLFQGKLPDNLDKLRLLVVLSVRRNVLNGSLPDSLGHLRNLRILDLSHNKLVGEVPDLSSLRHLQVLNLENNLLGTQFPIIGSNKILTLIIRNNKFNSAIPKDLHSFNHLQRLDISFNKFVGPFEFSLLSLPSIIYLNIEGNRFTGILSENMACNPQLELVDLTGNLFTGRLPSCLYYDPKVRVVSYARNCLVGEDESQHPVSFCRNEALAVGILPHHRRSKQASSVVLAISISAGIVGVILLVAIAFLTLRRMQTRRIVKSPSKRLIQENAATGYTSKLLQDARYISRALKLEVLGVPAYRTFSLTDIEDATNNFDASTIMDEGSYSQMYRGKLKDGSLIAIRCLTLNKRHNNRSFMNHVEVISKLRHQHLVSALGHCFDESSVSRIFLLFEYVPNGTLRDWIQRSDTQALTWSQRIAVSIGIAKGIQFLHTGIVPGVFSNNLKITDILLDLNFVAKISSHNLPLLTEYMGKVGSRIPSVGSKEVDNARIKWQEKSDIYDLGVILLEIIEGKHADGSDEVDIARNQLEAINATAENGNVDPAVQDSYSNESVKIVMQICSRCLLEDPAERPSIEDVLWNLQFAAQVLQNLDQSTEGSSVSPIQSPRLQTTIQ